MSQYNLASVFDSFKSNASGLRTSTRLYIIESLRQNYPKHHVTCVNRNEYDFIGFAAQGHAKVELRSQANDHTRDAYDSTRSYVKPKRLVASASGELEDKVMFGHYQYVWNEHEFILYKGKWSTTCWGSQESVFFVLSPRSEATINDSHSSITDSLLLAVGKWTSVSHDEIYVFDQSYWQKSKELWQSIKGASWDDVILEPKMKDSLIEDVQGFFDSQKLYQQFAVPWKRGIILHGVPGCGKTISIKALINYLAERPDPIPSLYVKSFENKCNGPQASVREIFVHARKMAPCLLVFEDLDSLVAKDVRSYFLNEVDGLESNDGILMIGSTNHLDSLDPAISKRPSRFDRKYHFRIPGDTEREAYCDYWRNKLSKTSDLDFPTEICPFISILTEGFSYAYLKELFVMTLHTIARGGKGTEEPTDNGWDVISNSSPPTEKVEGAEGSNVKDGAESNKEEKPALKKKQLKERPQVNVPEVLKDNTVLRVIQQQVKVLLHEMDNTEEENNPLPALSKDGHTEATTTTCLSCNTMRQAVARARAAATR